MKLSPDGLDIPVSFLNRLQDDQIVFFCGAGVSMRSGLPDFRGLVKQVFTECGESFDGRRYDYDRMLEELENNYPNVREKVRRILAPDTSVSARRLENHRNILRLAAVGGDAGRVRLVTTNFDDRFLRAAKLAKSPIIPDDAPKLPMPEDSEWASLVHLHGRICEGGEEISPLILTSSDFGRAYLIQGWARRFVTQLLREWHVAFVGYGLNDPPMRYLMDAAAAIRRRNPDSFRESYAFAPCRAGREDEARMAWKKKGITTPILYRKGNGTGAHSLLWRTLGELADLKENPLRSRENIVLMDTGFMPDSDTAERVVWALTSPATAQTFAERKLFSDAADGEKLVNWLDAFKKAGLFRAENAAPVDARACPPHSPHGFPKLPSVASHLASWAARHTHQLALLHWMVSSGGLPHPEFISRLHYFVNKAHGIEPKEMPAQLVEMWNLYLQEQITSPPYRLLFGNLRSAWVKSEWVKTNMERHILAALRPRPRVVPEFPLWLSDNTEKFRVKVDIDCEMDHANNGAYFTRKHAKGSDFVTTHAEALAAHLEEAASLITRYDIDTFRLRCFRPEEDDHNDPPHWLFLTLLVRDAVLKMIERKEISRLRNLVVQWTASEHLLLRRLALFVVTETAKFPAEERLSIDEAAKMMTARPDILWTLESGRESCRFLRKAGAAITPSVRAELERVIREGPPRSQIRRDLSDEEVTKGIRRMVAIYLAKLELSGAQMLPESVQMLAVARETDPGKEFHNFMEYPFSKITTWQAGEPGMPEFPGMTDKQEKPKWAEWTVEQCVDHIQTAQWLNLNLFIAGYPDKAVKAFETLAMRKFWQHDKWLLFLRGFESGKDISDEHAVRLIQLLELMPEKLRCGLVRECAQLLQIISRTRPFSEMERVWHRAWECDSDPRPTILGDHTSQLDIAINNPHGQLAEIPLTRLNQESMINCWMCSLRF